MDIEWPEGVNFVDEEPPEPTPVSEDPIRGSAFAKASPDFRLSAPEPKTSTSFSGETIIAGEQGPVLIEQVEELPAEQEVAFEEPISVEHEAEGDAA